MAGIGGNIPGLPFDLTNGVSSPEALMVATRKTGERRRRAQE